MLPKDYRQHVSSGPSAFLRALSDHALVFDGSMGATIQNMDLDVDADYLGRENCVDILCKTRPDLIRTIHEGFLAIGADVLETNTFGANRHVFAEFDEELAGMAYEINKAAAATARAAADAYATADRPRFVAGSIGPGTKLITLDQISWEAMKASYREQAQGLIDGGVDCFIIETCQDLLQVKCAVNAVVEALVSRDRTVEDTPIIVSLTIETTGTMLLGTEIAGAVEALRSYPIACLGLNCATGPSEMTDHLTYLARHWDRFISVIPNAGLPVLVEGKTEFPLTPEELAAAARTFIAELGVDIVGGCCGTQVEHIAALRSVVDETPRGARPEEASPPGCTSLYGPTEYRQDLSFLIVGERMNASGSRKFKRLLEEENWDEIIAIGREQMREGANVLDLNVDYAGRDNVADMAEIVKRLVRQVDAPLMIDSTQVATIECGLKHAPGKCIINSTNFEDGEEKFDAVCALARTYGAALVIGSIDEDEESAMARTADRKFEIAARAYERAVEVHGLNPADLFFDPLVLPISTGMASDRRSALELIEGTRKISDAFPETQLTCGLSNVSFGLKPAARVVLNSVFLHELMEAGMTGAIVHASKILPLSRIPDEQIEAAMNLIYDRRAEGDGGTGLPSGVTDESFDPLAAFIECFADVEHEENRDESRAGRTIEQRLHDHIVEGDKQDLTDHLDEAMTRYAPLEIINDHLLGGMKVVGELFGSGQMQLPFVLQSAEVMKMAVAHLEPHMEKVEGETKGTIVLATVKGDVHDIGKNLVDIILTNNGYTVHNLGIKQPIAAIVEAIERYEPDAVGLSGLLVKSVVVMEENLHELNERACRVPILLGGAALTRHYGEGHLRSIYDGPLYYGKDAFEGMRICDHLMEDQLGVIDAEIDERLRKRAQADRLVASSDAAGSGADAGVAVKVSEPAVAVSRDHAIPTPPFWGSRVIESVDLNEIYPYINPIALFRGQWGFKKGARSDEEYDAYLEDTVLPVFDRLKSECRDDEQLQPKVVYGYFPCHGDGNDLIVYDPADHEREIERFTFPRQEKRDRRCIADFFTPVDSGMIDVIGVSCVTVGSRASERAKELFESNAYSEYLYLHGLSVETAEALAELWHKRMRMELGISKDDSPRMPELFRQQYRGSRYSPGYPACPEMSDQEIIFRLLDPARIGCSLTENWQIDPEQSTSALIVHHPEAKYFNV